MRTKKFSNTLIEARTVLDFSPEEMAFVLSKKEQIYKLYEKGDFDDVEDSRQKQEIEIMLAALDLEIEKKILVLRAALWKFQTSTYFYSVRGNAIKRRREADRKAVKKNVTTLHSNHRNSNGKGSNH